MSCFINPMATLLMGMLLSSTAFSQAGSIAPDAKKMICDEMLPFFGNHAVIVKGSAHALINEKAEITIPYGKGVFTRYHEPSTRGSSIYLSYFGSSTIFDPKYGTLGFYYRDANPVKLLYFQENNVWKYITTSGKISTGEPYCDQEGYSKISSSTGATWVKYNGEKIIMTQKAGPPNYYSWDYTWSYSSNGNYGFSNGLMPARTKPFLDTASAAHEKSIPRGYINRKGEWKIKPKYYEVSEFSEGIAFVSQINEYGESRWGAVDTLDNLVIPISFRSQPTRFSSGRAMIKAYNQENIEAAFIDKKGRIVFTIPKNSGDTIMVYNGATPWSYSLSFPGPEPFLFMEGYTYVKLNLKSNPKSRFFLLDTNGHYSAIGEIMHNELPEGTIYPVSAIKNGQFLFMYESTEKKIGLANIDGSIAIAPVFDRLYLFENESPLQYAEISKIISGKKITTSGYIDNKGVFRVIRSDDAPGY